jgi:hypothetical protein
MLFCMQMHVLLPVLSAPLFYKSLSVDVCSCLHAHALTLAWHTHSTPLPVASKHCCQMTLASSSCSREYGVWSPAACFSSKEYMLRAGNSVSYNRQQSERGYRTPCVCVQRPQPCREW